MEGRCHRSEPRTDHQQRATTCGETFNYDRSLARLGGDPGLFVEIVTLFLEDAPQLLARAHDGLEQRNLPELERAAHSLKGLSVNFDAMQLVSAASNLEQLARENDIERAAACYPDLEHEYARLSAELRAFRDSLRH
jgi:HPt (histidine-containing phosphotransfer) domain-containing protein